MYASSAVVREQLIRLSRGRRSEIPLKVLAHYVLDYGVRAEMAPPAPVDDFVRFARRLYSLPDTREN